LKEKLKCKHSAGEKSDKPLESLKSFLASPEKLNLILGLDKGVVSGKRADDSVATSHHHHHLEMFITLAGKHKYWLAGKAYTARAGDVFIIAEDVEHQIGYLGGAKNFIDIWLGGMDKYRFCAREWNFFKHHTGKEKQGHAHRYFILEGAAIEQFASAWDKFTKNEETAISLLRLKYAVEGILFTLIDMIEESPDGNMGVPDYSLIVSEIRNYIEKNISADLSLKALAHIAGFDPFYFHKLFKKHTGEPVHSYVNRVKFNKACVLLEKGWSASSVAEELKFTSPFYFSRFFKRLAGIAPGKWQATRQAKKKRQ
jgi:AraC-like DNA-binding protein